jgi:enoyl-CoA hydratase/carnithine racemase
MQQAYRVIRVVAEAQTIRIVLPAFLTAQALRELRSACSGFNASGSNSSEVKAVILDFAASANGGATSNKHEAVSPDDVEQARTAVQALAQPTLAVVRDMLGIEASAIAQAADLLLMSHSAALTLPATGKVASDKENYEKITGTQAIRNKYTTWSVAPGQLAAEMERILDMLREQSALALRLAKASVNLGSKQAASTIEDGTQTASAARLRALKEVNTFYLINVMKTADAAEGLQAFLAKRRPQWKNR